ncbi:OmpW family protein [Halomonas beimenensis]|uniref:Outer membrane protein W n=1 Tax=Halomonas beimenensis TaxID=475662 RepID=A0A291P554_9GAMM|nr:OmpW family outer membrane protein [Halomonas beimenensis]ATJ81988.1 outer membrane protein W precursor [Halomonas beimenensis]
MKTMHLITATAFAAAGLVAAQSAYAYQAGDIYVRGGIAKTEVTDDNGTLDVAGELDISDESHLAYALGYLFHDKWGMELSGAEPVEHQLNTGNLGDIGGVDRMPVNLMVNYYPLGGTGAKVQPYVGAGLNYTRFSDEELDGLDVDESWGAVGQVGVDLAITDYLLAGAFARYADVDADVSVGGTDIGEAEVDPMTVGGVLTFRF